MNKEININLNWSILLTIVLLLLRAFKIIHCAWIWVFAPLWVSFIISIILLFIISKFN